MRAMSDSGIPESPLSPGQLPPIPDGCGILPVAENRIVRGPHPELPGAGVAGSGPISRPPEGAPAGETAEGESDPRALPVLNDALEQRYRLVLVMRDMEQLDTEEAANALGISQATVKMRLHRARAFVRKQLAEYIGAHDGEKGGNYGHS